MTFRVQLTSEARAHLLAIDEWWTANRPEAPDLVAREFSRAVSLLATTPSAGKTYPAATSASFRRLLLRRTEYHVYYLIDESARVVLITAIWSGVRGRRPPVP